MTDRLCGVFSKQVLQAPFILTQLRTWLLATLVNLLGYVTSDDFLDGILRNVKLTGNLPDRFLVTVVGLANFTDGFHYQHLLSCSSLWTIPESMEEVLGWVNFGRRLPPKVGQYCTPIHNRHPADVPYLCPLPAQRDRIRSGLEGCAA